jgi:hypothetical protein
MTYKRRCIKVRPNAMMRMRYFHPSVLFPGSAWYFHDPSEEIPKDRITTYYCIYDCVLSRDIIGASIISEARAWKNAWRNLQTRILEELTYDR